MITLAYSEILDLVKAGDPRGDEQLYYVTLAVLKHFALREVGPDVYMDRIHEAYIAILIEARAGAVEQPDYLDHFIRTVGARRIYREYEYRTKCRRRYTGLEEKMEAGFAPVDSRQHPEETTMDNEQWNLLVGIHASALDRTILQRAFQDDQPWQVVCKETGLTYDQFRSRKSRVKQTTITEGRKRLGSHSHRRVA